MKALAIVALVFASLSIFIPLGGILIALLCGIFALITFRSQITLSSITFGLNIINTAFLTPSLFILENLAGTSTNTEKVPTDTYFAYLGFHVALLVIAILWRLIRGAPKQSTTPSQQSVNTSHS